MRLRQPLAERGSASPARRCRRRLLRAVADFGRAEREEADGAAVAGIKQLCKYSELNIEEPMEVAYETSDEELLGAIAKWEAYIKGENQAVTFVRWTLGAEAKEVDLRGAGMRLIAKRN